MTVAELQRRISARELVEWQAYEMVFGPIGPVRDDILSATQSMHVIRAAGGKNLKLDDYLPRWGQTREAVDGVDQESADQAGSDS